LLVLFAGSGDGAYTRVTEQFSHWHKRRLDAETKAKIIAEVRGTTTCY